MKKTVFIFFCGLFLAVPSLTQAKPQNPGDSNGQGWYLGTGLGVDAPIQGWDSNFPLAGGGNIFTGYRFSPSFALQLSVNPWFFTGGGLSITDLRISPELRISNPGDGWSPYVLMGPAYDFQFDSPSGYTTNSVAGVVGIGFQFDFHPGEHAFIEARYDFLVYNNLTQEDVPVLVGLSEDL